MSTRTGCVMAALVLWSIPAHGFAQDNEGPQHLTYEASFTKALEAAKAASRDATDLFALLPYAKDLARAGRRIDVPFLGKVAAESRDAFPTRLALLTLARRGGDDAIDILHSACIARRNVALPVLYHASPEVVRAVALRMIAADEDAEEVRAAGARLLGLVGDKASAVALGKTAGGAKDEGFRHEANAARLTVESRLRSVPAKEQRDWLIQELRREAGLRQAWASRSLSYGMMKAARSAIKHEGEFTVSFLRSKIRKGDEFALTVAGEQRTGELVGEISGLAESGAASAGVARWALVRIGTDAALESLGKQMAPGRIKRNKRIATLLGRYGGASALPLLRKYAEDPRYKESRAAFEEAMANIRGRCAAEQQGATTRPAGAGGPSSRPADRP